MTIFSKKTDQSGRSMVEMLGVLAIIGVLRHKIRSPCC